MDWLGLVTLGIVLVIAVSSIVSEMKLTDIESEISKANRSLEKIKSELNVR